MGAGRKLSTRENWAVTGGRKLSTPWALLITPPSKLQRPAVDRGKTDARNAAHLAWRLRLDDYTAEAVPSVEQEAARELVRSREDRRTDLMRPTSADQTAAAALDRLLRRQRLNRRPRRLAAPRNLIPRSPVSCPAKGPCRVISGHLAPLAYRPEPDPETVT